MNSSKKFKIAVVNSYYYPESIGGAEMVVKKLTETYRKLGHQVFVITSGARDSIEEIEGIRVYRLHNRNIYRGKDSSSKSPVIRPLWHLINVNNPLVRGKVKDILSSEKPDIIHTHNLSELSFGVLKEFRSFKVVHTLHDHSFMCVKATMFKNMKNCEKICTTCSIYAALKKKFINYIDFVVGTSRYIITRHQNLGFFTDTPFSVIYNPVIVPFPEHIEKDFKNPTFGFIGKLHPSKGIEVAIKTFNEIDAPLLIAGSPYTSEYGKFLNSLVKRGNIKFLGWVDATSFYSQIDVLVVPSLCNDSSPTVVHEANAYGIPVIASNRGGLPELVKHKETGIVFDIDSQDGLKKAILGLSESELWKMSRNAFAHAREFAPEDVASKYISIMSELT